MSKKQGNPASVRLLGVMRGAPGNAPRALIRHEGGILMVDPRECLELGLEPREMYRASYGHGFCDGEAKTEEALRWLKSRSQILDQFPFIVAHARQDGIVLAVSGPPVPGVSEEEVIGRNVCEFLPSARHNAVLNNYEDVVRTGRLLVEEERVESELGWWALIAQCTRSLSGDVLIFMERQARPIPGMT